MPQVAMKFVWSKLDKGSRVSTAYNDSPHSRGG